MKKLLLVSNDEVGPRMAGPGIRYYNFARQLAEHHEVELIVPTRPDSPLGDFEVLQASDWHGRRFRSLAKRCDIVIAQTLRPWTMQELARADVRVIYDLYDPLMIGNLDFTTGEDVSALYRRVAFRGPTLLQQIALLTGNGFICASERQRDFWLGMLGAAGRIDPEAASDDPTFRDLIDVVPFGMDEEPPSATGSVLRGVVDGIGEGDKVLLWGGGIWNWLDPLTPIRAVHVLSQSRDDVKLFFLGVKRPNRGVRQQAMVSRAVELADELRLRDRFVFFNFGWVPYEERASYLLESDLGVSSHLDTLEARFSFRTRVLDYFWAGLPTVATQGDVLSTLIAEQELGRTVAVGSVEGWTTAITELVDDAAAYARARQNVLHAREAFAWSRVVQPLLRLAGLPGTAVELPRRATAMTVEYNAIAAASIALRHGMFAGAREAYGLLRRPPVP